MKRLLAGTIAVMAMGVAGVARAEKGPDEGLGFDATLDFYTAYVWRGRVVNDRPVWQPSVTMWYGAGDYGKVLANIWANFDWTTRNNNHRGIGLDEIDYRIGYEIDLHDFTFEAGHIWHTFERPYNPDPNSTYEFYAGVSHQNEIVTPFFRAYYDYVTVDGWYLNSGLNRGFQIMDQLTVGGEISLGWGSSNYMDAYFNTGDSSGVADFNKGLFATFALTDNLSLGARATWMTLIDGDARDRDGYRAAGSWARDIVWGGINLAASF